YLKKLSRGGTPLVLVDRGIRGLKVPTVIVDNEAGSHEAVNYLISLGHRRIGIITGLKGVTTSEERLAGYKRALEENHISPDPKLIKEGDYRREKARKVAGDFIRMKHPPTALFVCNEPMTSGALLALRENKVKIPEEMAVLGFDDPAWAPLTEPALTTVSQPSYSMGTLACQTLLKEINHSKIPSEDIILKPKLITRESSEKRIIENFDVEMAFSEDDK
ncbi:substrate-binding domain-containing protein, partial [Candidatus Aerophobetes bacterium]|nr:substrate-binding domain-containing protein [Candidatus Aerophobetes bacterium]